MAWLTKIAMLAALLLCAGFSLTQAQGILNKKITITTRNQRLDDVLAIISNQADFTFSYNSNIIRRDSLVTITASDNTVRQVLHMLLPGNYEYKESGNYLIIRKTALRITSIVKQTATDEKVYSITGYIVNGETGERISKASIYEPLHLVSALTDDSGRFTIRLKRRNQSASLAISKANFEDTTVVIRPSYNMQLEISLVPVMEKPIVSTTSVYYSTGIPADSSAVDSSKVINAAVTDIESKLLARLFLTARQKTQSLNIKKFFSERPAQISVWPGVNIWGQMGSQVINDFSLNIIGGYTGGVNIAEIGGIYNINRKDVKYVQVAGVFNMVGGSMKGVQAAGAHNTILKDMKGAQLSGISNHVSGSMNGVQVAGLFNYAKKMEGVQLGLVNIADSSDGYSIGLINIVVKGYHKVALTHNEVTDINIGFKTGSRHLYSILQAGSGIGNSNQKLYSFGYGLGREIKLNRWLSCNPELNSNYLYTGSWDHFNLLNRLGADFNVRLGKNLSVAMGPVVNFYYTDQTSSVNKYRYPVVPSWHFNIFDNNRMYAWVGWNAGINIF